VQGEHTHGVLGPIQGAMVRSRMLVPRRALPVARSLAEDIVGPFDERPELGDDDAEGSPFRTSAELAPADEPGDDAPASDEPEARGSPRRLRPRSYAVLMLIVLSGASVFGLASLYVRRNTAAGILATLSVFSLVAWTRGAEWPPLVLAGVWVFDLISGVNGVYEDDRRLAALDPPPSHERPVP
jgi:hypothetical protein